MSTDYMLNVVTVLTNCDPTAADFVKKKWGVNVCSVQGWNLYRLATT